MQPVRKLFMALVAATLVLPLFFAASGQASARPLPQQHIGARVYFHRHHHRHHHHRHGMHSNVWHK